MGTIMKTHPLKSAAFATALLATPTAMAGEVYQPNPVPYQEPTLYHWFVGGSVGYLVDAEEELYTLHVGRTLPDLGSWQQSIFFEIGYSDLENDGSEVDVSDLGLEPDESFTGEADIEASFIPITLNYKLDRQISGNLGFYAGAGAGVALIDVDGEFNDSVLDINDSGNDSETSFYAQAMVGLDYAFTDSFEMFLGARYMFLDEYEVSTDTGDVEVDDADDWLIELGGRYHF